MKILHYINNLSSGGAEKLLTDILPAFKNEGCKVSVLVCNNDKSVKKFIKILENENIEVETFQTSLYNPLQIFRLIIFINKNGFDIVHAHLFPSQYWLAFASLFIDKKIKLVKTEHSVHNERKNYKILKPLEIFVYSRYNTIIAISQQVKNNLEKWLGSSKNIEVVHNGVNLNEIKEAQKKETDIKLAKGVNLFMVGRFDGGQKDQSTLIKALSLLPSHYNLYLAGEGPYMNKIKEIVHDLNLEDRVNFLGLRSDVYTLMNLVNLNILSTNHEGLSGVALESLASGKPFIGSDVVGVNNIVPDSSYLFPKQNPKALAQKIELITSNLKLQELMVEKALKHVEKFDTSIMVTEYLNIYKKLLKID